MVDGNHSENQKLSSTANVEPCTCDVLGHALWCPAAETIPVRKLMENLGFAEKPLEMKVKLLSPDAKMPTRAHTTDSGFDVYAVGAAAVPAHGHVKVPLGIALEPPYGFEVQVRGRSGMAGKGIFVHPGTVDCEFRGEIAAHLFNHSATDYIVHPGDRVCQIVVKRVPLIVLYQVDQLSSTTRGEKGFGSTGR